MKKDYKYFIFDWDGTLAMTMHTLIDAYKAAFAKRGLLLTNIQLKEQIFGNWQKGIKEFALLKSDRIFDEVRQEVEEKIKYPDLYPFVSHTLRKLYRANKKLAVITLTPREKIMQALRFNKLEKIVDVVITGDEVQQKKPHPMLLVEAQKQLNAGYYETIFIGNSVGDAEMGKNAKLITGIFAPEENDDFFPMKELVNAKPDFIFRNFDFLEKRYV